jgi:hypothetical protein
MVILLAVLMGAFVIVRMTKPEILDSRLVRTGAGVLFGMSVLLFLFPALITGILFMFSAPIALLLILAGTILSFVNSDKRMNDDVAALVVAAKRARPVWPTDPPLRQVTAVAKHGLRAGLTLVCLLRFESDEQFSDETWSPNVEQQVALALCRIYDELPLANRTVYDVRATSTENSQVKEFWNARVHSTREPETFIEGDNRR